ncbi:MAG: hypothetical protein ACE5FN_08445 [Leptospirillia bacterium]
MNDTTPQSPDSDEAPAPDIAPPRRYGLLRRYWRGEVSLGRSFWWGVVAVALVYRGLVAVWMMLADTHLPVRGYAIGALGIFWIGLLLSVWQLVGCWRAARDRGWVGVGVRTLLGLGMLFAVAVTVPEYRGLAHLTRLAFLPDPFAGYTVRVVNHGTELAVEGPLGLGVARQVLEALDAHPNVRVVHLNSNGGVLEEGERIGQAVRERGLITFSSKGCVSSCTVAFVAGSERVLHQAARLGFHQPRFFGSGTELARERMKELYLAAGVDSGFVETALNMPFETMWRPEPEVLIDAGVIHRVTGDGEFSSATFPGVLTVELLEKAFLKQPGFIRLRAQNPARYTAMLEALEKALAEGEPLEKLVVDAAEFARPAAR